MSTNISANSTALSPVECMYCHRFQDEEYFMENFLSTLASIILNILSCPLIIVLNLLVIMAIKRRPRLQKKSNILLAFLAGTDLFVGIAPLPISIAADIFIIAGGSANTYCEIYQKVILLLRYLCVLASLFHLVLISIERYIAIKFALRYEEIVTKQRLTMAVSFSWFLAGLLALWRTLGTSTSLVRAAPIVLVISSILVIAWSHTAVYLNTRRHEKQIRTEQISREVTAKFLDEKKAWKTTICILGFVFLSFLPALLISSSATIDLYLNLMIVNVLRPFALSCIMLNSLFNPLIYCLRIKALRQDMIALLTRDMA